MTRVLASLLLLGALASGLAQPYAADGGFDRPREAYDLTRPTLAGAIDQGRPRLLLADARGLRLIDLAAGRGLDAEAPRWLAQGTVVRGVAAASGWDAADAAVYAWWARDTATGRYHYWWQWGDEHRALLETPQELDLALSVGPAGPEAWVAVPGADGGRLDRHAWDATEAEVMLRSERSLAAPTLARDADGALHLAFLEGATIDTPIGRSAEWSAVYLPPDGAAQHFAGASAPPGQLVLDLGPVSVLLWPRADGRVIASHLSAPHDDVTLGVGRALGVARERAFWSSGTSIVAAGLPLRGAPAGAPVNVAWSPYTVERGLVLRADDVTFLSWVGSLPGSGSRALHSDDARAMPLTWRDHLAAWFGWSPWALGEEAAGQLAGALLAAVLGTMVLLPLLWLLTMPLSRRLPERWTRLGGALVAVTVLLVLGLALAARATGDDAAALLGGVWGFVAALALGLALPPLVLARVDLEPQPALVAAAGLASFVSLGVMAFVALQVWFRVLGL